MNDVQGADGPGLADAQDPSSAWAILDSLPDLIIRFDAAGRVLYVNRAACETLEYARAELLGSLVGQLAPDFTPDVWGGHWRDLRRGGPRVVETVLRCRSGRHIEVEVSVQHGSSEGREWASASVRDIAARKQALQEFQGSRQQFDTMLREGPIGMLVVRTTDSTVLEMNTVFEQLYGYSRAEMIGRSSRELDMFSPETRAEALRLLQQDGIVRNMEQVVKARDGRVLNVSSSIAPFTYGGEVCLLAMVMDVTERKAREEALRKSEEKFALAFRRAPLVMSMTSLQDAKLLDVNDRFTTVTGFSREEALGKTAVELGLMDRKDRNRIRSEFERTRHLPDRELLMTAKDGRKFHVLWCAEVILVDGRPELLTIAQDISETVRLQEEVAKTQKLESLGLLAGGLAHDFNNVLTGVLGNLSFARMLVGEQHNAARCLAECEKAAGRASELTRQLLTFSRGGAPSRKAIETRRVVEEAVSFALRGSNVNAIVDLPADLAWLHADEGQIAQVLANLLINAKQAMPAGGTLTLRGANHSVDDPESATLAPGNYVRLQVADTGEGIESSSLSKVFDPYYTTKPGGTGLGLSSVYSIVKRHAGRVEVASVAGQGATFTLYLPAAAPSERPSPEPVPAVPNVQGGRGRVLVMDDETLIRNLACRVLDVLGYEATACAEGSAAVAAYRAALQEGRPFAAVLLDLTVPGGMGGRDAAAQILAIDPKALLIVSSGYSIDPVVADFRAYGFAGAVAKPYAIETLAAELDRLLGVGA